MWPALPTARCSVDQNCRELLHLSSYQGVSTGRELVLVAVLKLFDFQLKRQLTECSYVTEAVVAP